MSAVTPGLGVMTFSPPVTPASGNSVQAEDRLLLKSFSSTPFVEFGDVTVNDRRVRVLAIVNEEDFPQFVRVEKIETVVKAGFQLEGDAAAFISGVEVGAASTCHLGITWTPAQTGPARQLLRFYVENAYRLSAKLIGNCKPPAAKKTKRRSSVQVGLVTRLCVLWLNM